MKPGVRVARAGQRARARTARVVKTLPSSTVNITGFRSMRRGWSFRTASIAAARTMAGVDERPRRVVGWRAWQERPWGHLGEELEVLDHGAERERREEREGADEEHGATTRKPAKSGPWVGSVPGPGGTVFFFASEPASASTATMTQ